jgi:predicted choloylglycine hydrolase
MAFSSTGNVGVRLNSIENNLISLQQAVEEGLKKITNELGKKDNGSSTAFNHQYFLIHESIDDDEKLVDEAHAEIMIDGIAELYLNTNDKNSQISVYLKKYTSIVACRYYPCS